MNAPRKTILIITALLAGIVFMSSCSKETEKQEAKAPAAVQTTTIAPDGKNTFTAVRNGQYVNLNWHIGMADWKIKQINIMRSVTGKTNQRNVAEMKPDAVSFQDCLPNKYAYWYRLRLIGEDGNRREIGPIKVDSDKVDATNYIKQEDKFRAFVMRTDDFATLVWEFPEDEYKSIRIVRNSQPQREPFFNGNGKTILTETAGKSRYLDGLQDPNAEYWYWFLITLDSGAIIYKGPLKAKYPGKK